MFYAPQLIPIQLQTVARFAAPDPWNNDADLAWTLSVYRMTAASNRNLYAAYSAEKQLESADGQNLDREDVLGVRALADEPCHILPVALTRLWQQGRVPNEQLPQLIASLEPRLERRDLYDAAAGQAWRRYVAYGILCIGAVFAAIGVWIVTASLRDGWPTILNQWMWFTMAAF